MPYLKDFPTPATTSAACGKHSCLAFAAFLFKVSSRLGHVQISTAEGSSFLSAIRTWYRRTCGLCAMFAFFNVRCAVLCSFLVLCELQSAALLFISPRQSIHFYFFHTQKRAALAHQCAMRNLRSMRCISLRKEDFPINEKVQIAYGLRQELGNIDVIWIDLSI